MITIVSLSVTSLMNFVMSPKMRTHKRSLQVVYNVGLISKHIPRWWFCECQNVAGGLIILGVSEAYINLGMLLLQLENWCVSVAGVPFRWKRKEIILNCRCLYLTINGATNSHYFFKKPPKQRGCSGKTSPIFRVRVAIILAYQQIHTLSEQNVC